MSHFTRRRAIALLPLGLLAASFPAGAQSRFEAGRHFQVLAEPQPANEPEVLEFFWYGCGYCHAFEPLLEAWREGHGDALNFKRCPAAWNKAAETHAALYHAAQELGALERLHPAFFAAIHAQGRGLLDEEEIAAVCREQDIDAELLSKARQSFAVNTALRRGAALLRAANPPSVPALLVNGRYLIAGNAELRGDEAMLAVADYLLALA